MLNPFLCVCLVIICLGGSASAQSSKWPMLSAKSSFVECRQVHSIAKAAFNTPEPELGRMIEIIDLPDELEVLSTFDADFFEQFGYPNAPMPEGSPFNSIGFGSFVHYGKRLVEVWYAINWKDYASAMYAIDQAIDLNTFVAKTKQSTVDYRFIHDSRGSRVLRSRDAKSLFIIDLGGVNEVLPDWNVYVSTPRGFESVCSIRFIPKGRPPSSLLPASLQQLLRLLDQTIGPGTNEGSLRPTATIRSKVQNSVAHAASRPWALSEPYNSRDIVEHQLEQWSRQSGVHKRIYEAIQATYPRAEKGLIRYYRNALHLPQNEASALAPKVLDVVLRTHYMFPQQ